MNDQAIVELFWARDEGAIPAVAAQYGAYCAAIARNILGDAQDAEECVNDVWLRAWNAMPPHRPEQLAAFLGKITRNLALNRWQKTRAAKRGGGQTAQVLQELEELLSDGTDASQALDRQELIWAIQAFLDTLKPEQRNIFLCRYWYLDSTADIAAQFGRTQGTIHVTLHRIRSKLRTYLAERGFDL